MALDSDIITPRSASIRNGTRPQAETLTGSVMWYVR